jgi:hypothetical protein
MAFALTLRGTPGADDPDRPAALGETDQEESVFCRVADKDFALLLRRTHLVVEDRREGVGEDRRGLLERGAVLPAV